MYENKLKDVKKIVMKEAGDWVRDQTKHITEELTKTHRTILSKFCEYSELGSALQQERETLLENWLTFEKAYAIRSPVMEAEFAHDDSNPLQLYDCLIPKLREHRELRIRPELYT